MIISAPMMSDEAFAQKAVIVPYYVRGVAKRGIPVGKYLILVNGYYIYNLHTKKPVIKTPFEYLIHAYAVAKTINTLYGKYLIILTDEEWSKYFFGITQWSVDGGKKFYKFISKLDNLYPKKVSWDNIVDALR